MKQRKATREQLKQHNRQLVLNAIYSGLADNRAALAAETGLAKPTVSDLVSELIDEGLLVEVGRGEAAKSGGKRPRLLEFVPDARHVIGVSVTEHQMEQCIQAVLANLDGRVLAEHEYFYPVEEPETILDNLISVINGLVAQLDAPLLCVGLGLPGKLKVNSAVLTDTLVAQYDVPVYVENNTELAATALYAFGQDDECLSDSDSDGKAHGLVTVLINHHVEIGYILGDGVYHNGGSIGELEIVPGQTLESQLGWAAVKKRALALRERYGSTLPEENLLYLHVRRAMTYGDEAALILHQELVDVLSPMLAWIIGLLRPQQISLAGGIVDLGAELLHAVEQKTRHLIDSEGIVFSLAEDDRGSGNLSARGAVAEAVKQELGLW
ncbi:MAG: ROK family transcriptional regulator [Chloroflexi bacterium]|nr:ROK family transcriptional regulator [Chloroflexota bacterium]